MISKNQSFRLNKDIQLEKYTSIRLGERKLGEEILRGHNFKKAKYIVLGISEDIGPQMNGGQPGSHKGFSSVLSKLCNMQSNAFLNGQEIGILGEITQNAAFKSIEESKGLIEELDAFVFDVLQHHVLEGQVLIVIGGGHNNALPILRFTQHLYRHPVFSINIDPHADCRESSYRHSGNSFSVAMEEKTIEKYTIFGLHESYNNQQILDFLRREIVPHWTFEQYLDSPEEIRQQFIDQIKKVPKANPTCLDIDLDSIAFMPSSAFTPSGFGTDEIRQLVRSVSSQRKINSLHLPEGAPNGKEEAWYGKFISYLICDFIKTQNLK